MILTKCPATNNRLLPPRIGAHPVDHAITLFQHVILPESALLGTLDKPKNERDHFHAIIHRVGVGALFLSGVAIPALKIAVYNSTLFSMRRKISGPDGKPLAVIKFRTQHLPILHAIAQYHVLQAFFVKAAILFRNRAIDPRVRHAVATVFKAAAMQHFQKSIKALNDGCGWHGYYEHNQILQLEVRHKCLSSLSPDLQMSIG